MIDEDGKGVTCKKCRHKNDKTQFHCSFCNKTTIIPVQYRVANSSGNATVLQMSVHKTVVFSINSN